MISPSQRPLPDNTQYSKERDIHAPGGIRTHNPSMRAAADLRLRPRDHWYRHAHCMGHTILSFLLLLLLCYYYLYYYCCWPLCFGSTYVTKYWILRIKLVDSHYLLGETLLPEFSGIPKCNRILVIKKNCSSYLHFHPAIMRTENDYSTPAIS